MYSPFVDSKGNPVYINRLRYSHLSQLVDCDEGHHLEYKRLLDDNVKAQLAKEIASFANCEGGWLVVGIDDKTHHCTPINKADYSQKIGKIVCRISPMPEFETRFLSLPNDPTKGVLVVYVYEGRNAPYICNGSVYVRSGSSKEPVKTAERGNIEYLYERSKIYTREVEEFCKRDFYFAYNPILQKTAAAPIANVYLKRISMKEDYRLEIYRNRDELIEFVKKQFPIFEHVSYSMESIIFMHKEILPGSNGGTLVFELYYDWSCKILFPIGCTYPGQVEMFRSRFDHLGISDNALEHFKFADGNSLCNAFFSGLKLFADIAKKFNLKEKEYAFCADFENAGDIVLVFAGDSYNMYISEYGIPYAHKEINRSEIRYFRNSPQIKFSDLAASFLLDYVGAAFGYRTISVAELITQSNDQIMNRE